eukprot:scaffold733_cov267-Pinguiococcus_pyrenoidosus.AAC.26
MAQFHQLPRLGSIVPDTELKETRTVRVLDVDVLDEVRVVHAVGHHHRRLSVSETQERHVLS